MTPPIFIIGNPRSGTTLLRLMLTSHRSIVIPPEGGFAVWFYDKYTEQINNTGVEAALPEFVDDVLQSRKFQFWGISHKGLLSYLQQKKRVSYSDLVSGVYEYYGLTVGRSFNRWGDKNNYYLKHINTIKRMFPDANFVHIVRDGRDVACSYRQLYLNQSSSEYSPKLPFDIEEIATEWNANVQMARDSFSQFEWKNVVEIRYEDLVEQAAFSLRVICTFLGEEYDPEMMQYYMNNRNHSLVPKEFLGWKERNLQPIDDSAIQKYIHELTNVEVETFNHIAKDQLEYYDYL